MSESLKILYLSFKLTNRVTFLEKELHVSDPLTMMTYASKSLGFVFNKQLEAASVHIFKSNVYSSIVKVVLLIFLRREIFSFDKYKTWLRWREMRVCQIRSKTQLKLRTEIIQQIQTQRFSFEFFCPYTL